MDLSGVLENVAAVRGVSAVQLESAAVATDGPGNVREGCASLAPDPGRGYVNNCTSWADLTGEETGKQRLHKRRYRPLDTSP